MKDVKLPDNPPKELLLNMHADYIEAFERNKDDYVTISSLSFTYNFKRVPYGNT